MNKNSNLRNKDLVKSIFWKILMPSLLAGASANLSSIIDGIVVGNVIGSNALAAMNACRPAIQICGFVSLLFASGIVNGITFSMGQNEKENANRFFSVGMLFSLLTAIVFTIIQYIFAEKICWFFASEENLYNITLSYYRIFLFSTFFIIICETVSSIMRTDGLAFFAGYVLLFPHIINTILDIILVKFFSMGLFGVGIATVIGYFMGVLLCCYYLVFKKTYKMSLHDIKNKILQIISVGISPAIIVGLISIRIIIINRSALITGGANALAIMSLIMILWAVESLFTIGVQHTLTPMIPFYYSDGDYHGVKIVFGYAIKILIKIMLVVMVFFLIFPNILPIIFGLKDAKLIEEAKIAIRIFVFYMPMESFIVSMITYYNSTENKKIAALLSVFHGLVSTVIVIYPLRYFFGIIGVWVSFLFAGLVTIIIIFIISKGDFEKFFRMKGYTYLKEFSIKRKEIPNVVDSVINAVCDAGFDKKIANRTGIAIEEAAEASYKRNQGKSLHIDVVVRQIDNKLLITFSDDGKEFDLLKEIEVNKESYSNIAMLKAISYSMNYGRVVGINKLDVVLQ